jgi:hypothetical protein
MSVPIHLDWGGHTPACGCPAAGTTVTNIPRLVTCPTCRIVASGKLFRLTTKNS